MNYLAHFFLARQRSKEPDFHMGSVLPDILSAYNRSIKFRKLPRPTGFLEEGVELHLRVDEWFHRSEFFKKHNQLLFDRMLGSMKESGIRLFFLSHITCEFLLDHVLLEKEPSLATEFYSSLHRCSTLEISAYVARRFQDDAADIRQHLETFLSLRFILSYDTLDGLGRGISAVLRRTGQNDFTDESQDAWLKIAFDMKPSLEQSFDELLTTFPRNDPEATHGS